MSAAEALTTPRPTKLTIDEFLLLDREWSKDDRYHSTELIDGVIYHTPARFVPRARVTSQLAVRLQDAAEALPNPPFVMIRGSIAMPRHDLPLPDIVLTYQPNGPGFIACASVPLVVEVAETALDFFTGPKQRLYARHGIPEYWVADLVANRLVRLWAPEGEVYARRDEWQFGSRVDSATITGLEVETAGLN